VRQESDYCPFKPQCDVIVNAFAHAPRAVAAAAFPVRLTVSRPGATPALIDKRLTVTGERRFIKKSWPLRAMQAALKWLTLTLVRPVPWRLGEAAPFTSLPLRDEFACGGQCRINAGDAAAAKIPARHRLTPEQLAMHPDANAAPAMRPAAHTACAHNLSGLGYAQAWYLRAAGVKTVAAPRIERPGDEFTAQRFWQAQNNALAAGMPEPAGLGIRGMAHPARHALLGSADEAFAGSGAALPHDFDFAIWNAAPADQQIDFLHGDEVFELSNLCRPDTPGAHVDAQGNTVLRLVLPQHECQVRMQLESGAACAQALVVDTVLIEPEERRCTLVWRAVLPREAEAPIEGAEFCLQTVLERNRAHMETAMRREV
jgi:hypothetical protein